jgi:hypothetical protein
MIVVAMMRAVGVLVGMGDVLPGRRGKLLEEMMHPMRCGGGEKEDKRSRHAQEQPASARYVGASVDHGYGIDLSKVVVEVQAGCRAAHIVI